MKKCDKDVTMGMMTPFWQANGVMIGRDGIAGEARATAAAEQLYDQVMTLLAASGIEPDQYCRVLEIIRAARMAEQMTQGCGCCWGKGIN